MTRPTKVPEFSAELRRLRAAAGLSISALADLIHFSKGYISKVETGQKSPGVHFARVADAALVAGGRLVSLTAQGQDDRVGRPVQAAPASSAAVPAEPRNESVLPRGLGVTSDEDEVRFSLQSFETILVKLRDIGQTFDPAIVLEMLKPHIVALRDLSSQLDGALAVDAVRLAGSFADFASWMTQETGDDVSALGWVDLSAALAAEASDNDMIANAFLRRANIALYQQDAYGTVSFARQAQVMECSARIRSLAVQREAQGHALAGDQRNFDACFDRAAALEVERAAAEAGSGSCVGESAGSAIGPQRIADPFALAKGWSLYDLGRSAEAIEILEPLLEKTKKNRSRAWARIACRLALALASVRETRRACALTSDILALTPIIRSATIRSELRQLSRMLNRWSADPSVQEIMPQLSAALLPTAAGYSSVPPGTTES